MSCILAFFITYVLRNYFTNLFAWFWYSVI